MNDMVSPSQSSPSMSGNAGHAKGSSGSENSTIVSFIVVGLFTFLLIRFNLFFLASHKASTAGAGAGSRSQRAARRGSRRLPVADRRRICGKCHQRVVFVSQASHPEWPAEP